MTNSFQGSTFKRAVLRVTRDAGLFLLFYITFSLGLTDQLISQIPVLKDNLSLKPFFLFALSISAVFAFRATLSNFFTYLDVAEPETTQRKSKQQSEMLLDELAKLRTEILSSSRDISTRETVKLDVSDEVKAQLLRQLEFSMQKQIQEDSFKAFDQELAKRELKLKTWEESVSGFDTIRERLLLETKRLQKRANINLFLGTFITIIAGIGLLFIVVLRPFDLTGFPKEEYSWRIVSHYIPRLSLIIFAQVFAFFFLRLYKADLADIKYYQNEITNVEMRLAALKTSLSIEQRELPKEDKEILKNVLAELVRTERNFVLKKGETTVELEKFKRETFDSNNLAAHIATVLKTKF